MSFFFSSGHIHLFMNSVHKEILSSVKEKEMRVYEGYLLISFGNPYVHIYPSSPILKKKCSNVKPEKQRESETEIFLHVKTVHK